MNKIELMAEIEIISERQKMVDKLVMEFFHKGKLQGEFIDLFNTWQKDIDKELGALVIAWNSAKE